MQIRTPHLGGRRGLLSDWLTQRWVQATGRRVTWSQHPWLAAPVGDIDVIGADFFHRYAARTGLVVADCPPGRCGLLEDFAALEGPLCRPAEVHPAIVNFYERTGDYELDVWSEWCALFRPFGRLLASIFSRRLQQLNVPLSPLDTRLGIRSRVLPVDTRDGSRAFAAWVRETVATGTTLYAGCYSICRLPGYAGPCVKVAFPLPNGYALVILRPESSPDGSLVVRSEGSAFGDPGFYFFVESEPGQGWARRVNTFKESIRLYLDECSVLRADHEMRLWGVEYLRLHYRMRVRETAVEPE